MQVVRLHFTPQHARSYNELVEVVRRNLLLADFYDEGHRESLLHKHAKRAPPVRPSSMHLVRQLQCVWWQPCAVTCCWQASTARDTGSRSCTSMPSAPHPGVSSGSSAHLVRQLQRVRWQPYSGLQAADGHSLVAVAWQQRH